MNKQERAYELIRSRIESGEYAAGQRLVIDSLAKEIGISQVPIREAIRRLEAGAWVVYHPNSGPVVAPVTKEGWAATLEVMSVLEGYATALAAPHITTADAAQLRRISAGMEAALRAIDLSAWSEGNRRFHQHIYDRCPNLFLVESLVATQARLDALTRTIFARERGAPLQILGADSGWTTLQEHASIVDAIEAGEPFATIEQLARDHKLNTLKASMAQLGMRWNGEPDRVDHARR